MGLRDKFKTSTELETKGIQFILGDVRFTLARAGGSNLKYNAAMERIAKEQGRALHFDLVSNDRQALMLRTVYADCVILNWETRTGGTETEPEYTQGLEPSDGGDDLDPFTKENVIAFLTEVPDLFREIREAAENIAYYRQSLLDSAVKN